MYPNPFIYLTPERQKANFDIAIARVLANNPASGFTYNGNKYYANTLDNFKLAVWYELWKEGSMGNVSTAQDKKTWFWTQPGRPSTGNQPKVVVDTEALYLSDNWYPNYVGTGTGLPTLLFVQGNKAYPNNNKAYYNSEAIKKWDEFKKKYASFIAKYETAVQQQYETTVQQQAQQQTGSQTNPVATTTTTQAGATNWGIIALVGIIVSAVGFAVFGGPPQNKPKAVPQGVRSRPQRPGKTPRNLK